MRKIADCHPSPYLFTRLDTSEIRILRTKVCRGKAGIRGSKMENRITGLFLLIGDINRASSRYRVYQYLPYFRKVNPDVVWSARESDELVKKARKADFVFIQKCFFTPRFLQTLRGVGVPLVYDFDDAVFIGNHFAPKVDEKSGHFKRFRTILHHCDLVLAGNAYLGEVAGKYHPRVKVIPTAVDVSGYPSKKVRPSGRPCIGWIGHSSNQPYLDLLRQPLARLRAAYPTLTFRVISDGPWSAGGIQAEFRRWNLHYLRELQKLDIGVMPLFNDPYAKGKCAYKALQYMASGIPVVLSPVGMNREVVNEGHTGFFAATPEEWFAKLLRLLTSADLRYRVGQAGRKYVETHYATHRWAMRLEDLLVREVRRRTEKESGS